MATNHAIQFHFTDGKAKKKKKMWSRSNRGMSENKVGNEFWGSLIKGLKNDI